MYVYITAINRPHYINYQVLLTDIGPTFFLDGLVPDSPHQPLSLSQRANITTQRVSRLLFVRCKAPAKENIQIYSGCSCSGKLRVSLQ